MNSRSLPIVFMSILLTGILIGCGAASSPSASVSDAQQPSPTPQAALASPNPTIIVKTLDDDPSGCPDKCTLRSAIDTAKSGDVIGFDPSLTGSLILVQTLIIDKDLSLIGPGADKLALDGNKTVRVLQINKDIRFNLSGLTIKNGNAGGGGGIYNLGKLTVTDSTISGNKAGNEGGGGILSYDTTITNSIISSNSSGYQGGGISGQGTITNSTISNNTTSREGGGIHGQWTITDSTISGNSAYTGGGVYNNQGSITNSTIVNNSAGGAGGVFNGSSTITNTTISDNKADNGGGVENIYGIITNSIISGNTASDNGGGVWNGDGTISNSTVTNNTASSGGGIWNEGNSNSGIITNSTISGNTASTKGGGITGKIIVTLGSNIIAGNTSKTDPDISGQIKSLGKNLIGNGKGITGLFASDQKDIDPLLTPLALNAPGTTQTLALKPGSPAIGKGKCDFTPRVTTDQRGVARKSECDVGAYETDTK